MIKEPIVLISYLQKGAKNVGEGRKKITIAELFGFRERISNFSLDLQEIRLSEFFEPRRKAVLRGKAYA